MSRKSDKVMWVLSGLLVVSLVGMAVGAAKMLGYDPTGEVRHPLIGRVAPPLDLPLVAGEGVGDRVSVAALEGQVVLLDFWATWCPPCRRSIPILSELQDRYRGRIALYGVNVDDDRVSDAYMREKYEEFGGRFPTLRDARLDAQTAYGVTSLPTLILIDRAGVVRWIHRGVPDPDEVAERIDDALEN